jgi:hypothetical protein
MASMTRGPLPPGVYWRRRLFVLALAGAMVFIVAGLLQGGSDGSDDGAPVAQQAGADYDIPSVTVDAGERGGKHARRGARARATYGPSFDPNVLAEPSGTCDPADVTVTPRVEDGAADGDVTIGLSFRSTDAAACTWHLTGAKLLVRITDADEEIWTTRECPDAVPDKDVVVRDVVATVVEMSWNGRESDEHCRADTDWALPGDYSIAAAVLGGEPDQTDFELTRATPSTVTVTPTPTQEPKQGQKYEGRDDLGPDGRPLGQNTDVPTR